MAGRTEKTIGDHTFYIRKLPPIDALRLVGNLQQRIIGPAAKLIAAQRNETVTDESFAAGLENFSKALDGDTLVWAYKQLVNPEYVSVQIEGEAEKLTDNVVARLDIQLDVLLTLTIEVAKCNFMDFGKSAGGLFGLVRQRVAAQ